MLDKAAATGSSGLVAAMITAQRRRRTAAEIDVLRGAIHAELEVGNPMTLRQLFYRLVSKGWIAKTEAEYDNVVGRLVKEMRLDGSLPWGWVTDNTRGQRRVRTFSGLEEAVEATSRFYRRDIWDNQPEYVEVWSEKDAISGVIWPVVSEWHVPLMVTRGYASLSFLYESAREAENVGKRVHIGYLGDWDPSGVDIRRNVEQRLRQFAPSVDLDFQPLAVTPAQIAQYRLLTRPTKASDSRARGFRGESVEVDAIEPSELRRIVEAFILEHVDQRRLSILKIAEESEQEILRTLPSVVRRMRG